MADHIGVAVIGCGFFAQNHLHAWSDLGRQGAELIAVCDIDADKAKAPAAKFNVPRWYTRLDDLLKEERPGLVDIITRVRATRNRRSRPSQRVSRPSCRSPLRRRLRTAGRSCWPPGTATSSWRC